MPTKPKKITYKSDWHMNNADECESLVRIRVVLFERNSGKVKSALGHFDDDGFYLKGGWKLANNWNIIAWRYEG